MILWAIIGMLRKGSTRIRVKVRLYNSEVVARMVEIFYPWDMKIWVPHASKPYTHQRQTRHLLT